MFDTSEIYGLSGRPCTVTINPSCSENAYIYESMAHANSSVIWLSQKYGNNIFLLHNLIAYKNFTLCMFICICTQSIHVTLNKCKNVIHCYYVKGQFWKVSIMNLNMIIQIRSLWCPNGHQEHNISPFETNWKLFHSLHQIIHISLI